MNPAPAAALPDVDVLLQEIDSLRAANKLQERQLLEALSQISEMVEETDRERRRAEAGHAHQRQLSELLARIENHLHDLLVVTDAEGRITRINQRCRDVFRIADAAVLGKSLDRLFPPDTVANLLESRRDALPLNRPALLEAIYRHPDLELELQLGEDDLTGCGRTHVVHGSLLHAPDGREEGCIVLATDISTLKAREAARRASEIAASETLARAAIDHIAQGIAVFDAHQRLLLWNEAFLRRLELAPGRVVAGTDFADLVTASHHRDPHLQITRQPMPGGGFVLTVVDRSP